MSTWDHTSHERFYDYYAQASQSVETLQRSRPLGRFDLIRMSKKAVLANVFVSTIRTVPVLRWLAHIVTPSTTILAVKKNGSIRVRDVAQTS
jgi:hypothetical protein